MASRWNLQLQPLEGDAVVVADGAFELFAEGTICDQTVMLMNSEFGPLDSTLVGEGSAAAALISMQNGSEWKQNVAIRIGEAVRERRNAIRLPRRRAIILRDPCQSAAPGILRQGVVRPKANCDRGLGRTG